MRAPAAAKINLALVVGSLRSDGKHEVVTVYQRIGLCDRIDVEPAPALRVEGFEDDTLVRGALERLADRAGTDARWRVRIEKHIPVAAGLGGGSSDAATALRLANETLAEPLGPNVLHDLAAGLGADVPYFLADGPCLGTGNGTSLAPLDLPQDYWIVLALPNGVQKPSTGEVYAAFDARDGAGGYESRRRALVDAVERVRRPRDLAALPPNDLVSSPLAGTLVELGAFRADVSGAGPAVYGLFHHRSRAEGARKSLERLARSWLTTPAWYG